MAFDARADAKTLRNAMKGLGTDEEALISVFGPRTNQQLIAINKAYTDIYADRNLADDIKNECNGAFEDTLISLLFPVANLDAKVVHDAIAGLGTNEGLLCEVLCTRTQAEMNAIGVAYKAIYGEDMLKAIKDDLSGDLKKLFNQLLSAKRDKVIADSELDLYVDMLYEAGENKIGTSEETFVKIICDFPRATVEKINVRYAAKYGKPLSKVIKSEFGGQMKRALVYLVQPIPDTVADLIHDAMEGAGTNDSQLIRTIASHKERHLKAANVVYLREYEKSIKAAVKDDCRGDYKNLLVSVLENFAEK